MECLVRKFACSASFSLGILATSAQAGGVRIVEPTGSQNFATIQSAVDAATSGSVLLVGAGTYPAFTVTGKSLSIFAVPGATVNVGGITVSGIVSNQDLVVAGLRSGSLSVQNSSGDVRFQDCIFTAPDRDFVFCPQEPGDGFSGARVTFSNRTAFHGCHLQGGKGEDGDDTLEACSGPGGEGGAGLETIESAVVLYDCQLEGGVGGGMKVVPGPGGPGAKITSSTILASNCTFEGGDGGANFFECGGCSMSCAGDGGPGCRVISGAVHEIGSSFQGGPGHFGQGSCAPVSGPAFVGSPPNSMAGPARRATVTPVVQSDASSWSVSFQGAAGDRPLLFASALPQFLISLPFHGAWLTRRSSLLIAANLGPANGSGMLNGSVAAPDLPAGSLLRRYFAQVPVRATVGVYLGSPAELILLDRNSGPDCNGNGISDFLDVIEGTSADANHNLIPDSCPGG